MYNAIGYSTSSSDSWKTLNSEVKAMQDWLTEPWCLTEAATLKKDVYGYEVAMQAKNSASNWLRCYELMTAEVWDLHLRTPRAY